MSACLKAAMLPPSSAPISVQVPVPALLSLLVFLLFLLFFRLSSTSFRSEYSCLSFFCHVSCHESVTPSATL